jgi:hypothetical protein
MDIKAMLKSLLDSYLVKLAAQKAGAAGWAILKLGRYCLDLGFEYYDKYILKKERTKTQDAAQKDLKEVDSKPESKPDDIGEAYEKTFNSN